MDPNALAASITTTSARDLCSSIRYDTSPPTTLVDGLDALLHGAGTPLRRGDVVEVQGLTGSGKTQLLVRLAVNALLPRKAHVRLDRTTLSVPVGGKEETVVWIDCTSKFDVDRTVNVLRKHLVEAINAFRRPKGIGAPTDDEVQSLVDECLTRLHVFTPTSTLQLAATVHSLPEWYEANASEPIGFVLIDGMTEFAWADQHEREEDARRREAPKDEADPAPARPSRPIPLQLFTASIARLRRTLAPVTFVTQWVMRPSHPHSHLSQQGLPFYRAHFTPPLYPSLGSTSRRNPDDPLAPVYFPPSSSPAFSLAFHITMHPPSKPMFRKGVSLQQIVAEQRKTVKAIEANGHTTEGIVCVLRDSVGRELGSWEMSIGPDEIVA